MPYLYARSWSVHAPDLSQVMQLWRPLARRNSVVSFLVLWTLSVSVFTVMPFSAGVEHDAINDRAPATSTRQIRQAPVGVQPFR